MGPWACYRTGTLQMPWLGITGNQVLPGALGPCHPYCNQEQWGFISTSGGSVCFWEEGTCLQES